MKKFNLQFFFGCCALAIASNVTAIEFQPSPPVDQHILITEQLAPPTNPDPALYNGVTLSHPISIPYTFDGKPALAILEICLADDHSTNFNNTLFIDSPMENALVANITADGTIPDVTFVDVQPNHFVAGQDGVPPSPTGDPLVLAATTSGIENPNLISEPITPCYTVDVTSIINGSGTLSFDLEAPNAHSDIYKKDNPVVWNMITAAANQIGGPVEDPYHVWQDYVYESAKLTIIPQQASIPTLSEWSMLILMLGLSGFAARRLKHS